MDNIRRGNILKEIKNANRFEDDVYLLVEEDLTFGLEKDQIDLYLKKNFLCHKTAPKLPLKKSFFQYNHRLCIFFCMSDAQVNFPDPGFLNVPECLAVQPEAGFSAFCTNNLNIQHLNPPAHAGPDRFQEGLLGGKSRAIMYCRMEMTAAIGNFAGSKNP